MTLFATILTAGQSLNISTADGVLFLSVIAEGGETTITGGKQTFKGLTSAPTVLKDTQTGNMGTSPSQPLDGVTISVSTGTANLWLFF